MILTPMHAQVLVEAALIRGAVQAPQLLPRHHHDQMQVY